MSLAPCADREPGKDERSPIERRKRPRRSPDAVPSLGRSLEFVGVAAIVLCIAVAVFGVAKGALLSFQRCGSRSPSRESRRTTKCFFFRKVIPGQTVKAQRICSLKHHHIADTNSSGAATNAARMSGSVNQFSLALRLFDVRAYHIHNRSKFRTVGRELLVTFYKLKAGHYLGPGLRQRDRRNLRSRPSLLSVHEAIPRLREVLRKLDSASAVWRLCNASQPIWVNTGDYDAGARPKQRPVGPFRPIFALLQLGRPFSVTPSLRRPRAVRAPLRSARRVPRRQSESAVVSEP